MMSSYLENGLTWTEPTGKNQNKQIKAFSFCFGFSGASISSQCLDGGGYPASGEAMGIFPATHGTKNKVSTLEGSRSWWTRSFGLVPWECSAGLTSGLWMNPDLTQEGQTLLHSSVSPFVVAPDRRYQDMWTWVAEQRPLCSVYIWFGFDFWNECGFLHDLSDQIGCFCSSVLIGCAASGLKVSIGCFFKHWNIQHCAKVLGT